MIKKIIKEAIENHDEKVGEIINFQLENMNHRIDRISKKVVDVTKSLE